MSTHWFLRLPRRWSLLSGARSGAILVSPARLRALRLRWQPGGIGRILRVVKRLDVDDPPIADGQER